MSDKGDDASLFNDDVYSQTFAKVTSLRRMLPKNSVELLAREVILRLRNQPLVQRNDVAYPSEERINSLSRALISRDAQAGLEFVRQIRAEGASAETVYLAYLQSAARQLGAWWEEDRISFVDVTIGTGHIYAIMRGLRPLFQRRGPVPERKSALFASVPGESHLLGVSMAADLFTKQGWDIDLKTGLRHDQLVEYAQNSFAPIIGLSAAGEHALTNLAKLVVALNINRPDADIVVSGNICEVAPDAIHLMDVGGQASSYREARDLIDSLWKARRRAALG